MNCDDFLTAQETGGPLQRLRASRHAARCPRCAALQTAFADVKRELATPEPLSARARQLWKLAAGEAGASRTAGPARSAWGWLSLAGGLAVAACVVLVVVRFTGKRSDIRPVPEIVRTTPADPPPVLTTPVVSVIAPAQELADLSSAVDRLDSDLKALQLQAQRAEARQQVAMTFERFSRW